MNQNTLDGQPISRLTPEERVKAFAQRFPDYLTPSVHNGALYTTWVIGAISYQSNGYYGSYPYMVLERILALFPDCKRIAHIFSGTVSDPDAITFDINPMLNPTIVGDIREIVKYKEAFKGVQLFVADPAYDAPDFEKYGVKPFNKAKAIRDLGVVAEPGAYLAWLDTKVPMYNKETWALLGHLGLVVSTNTRVRMWSLWERTDVETPSVDPIENDAQGGLET